MVEPKPPVKGAEDTPRLLPVVLPDRQVSPSGIQITLPSGVMIGGITEQHVSVALQLLEQL